MSAKSLLKQEKYEALKMASCFDFYVPVAQISCLHSSSLSQGHPNPSKNHLTSAIPWSSLRGGIHR